MPFKFSEIEGFDPELAARLDADDSVSTALAAHHKAEIEGGVAARVEVAKGEFKKKMDSMGTKLADAEARAEGRAAIDPEELKALRLAADKSPELTAQLEAMKKTAADAETAAKQRAEENVALRRSHVVTQAVNEHNAANPTVALKPDAHDLVEMLAANTLRYDEDAKTFRVYQGQEIVATDKGAATPQDWIAGLRESRPSLFAAPVGGGAPGSRGSGSAGEKQISRSDFEALAPARQGEVARTHAITD